MAFPDSSPLSAWLELPGGRTFQLGAACGIGRHVDNDIVLDQPALSRHHAKIALEADGYTLSDLRSRNGSYVNGLAVTRPVKLRDGDEVRLGDATLRFRCPSMAEPRVAAVDLAATQRIDQLRERRCWLMLVDIAGSATLNQAVGSAAAHRQIQDWMAALQPLIEANQGRINGYLGDAIYAHWLAESTPPAAVIAALRTIEAWRPASPLAFRTVLHFGAALFTHSDFGQELTGHDVNFLFRSEKVAKKLGVNAMLTEAAAGSLGLREALPVAGKSMIEGLTGTFTFYGLPAEFAGARQG